MIKKTSRTTPERWSLPLFLILSIAVAATAMAADTNERLPRPATEAIKRLPSLVSLSLSSVGGAWSAQGPAPIQNGQVEGITNKPVIGAINTVLAHPTNADILWVGSVNGGIWKTTNATNASPTWTPQTDTVASLSISSIERDPTDATHATLVASTGPFSSFWSLSGPLGVLFRTINGGTAWSQLNPASLVGLSITGIAPRGSVIVASVTGNCTPIFRSTNTGSSFSAVSGLPGGDAFDLAGDPTNNAVMYAAIQDCSGSVSGIYKSTNTGSTWTRVSNSTMNTLVNNANNAEISVGASGQIYVGIVTSSQLAGIFRSGNGGSTWTQLDTPQTVENGTPYGIHVGQQGYLHFSLAADPTNANLVYVGGDRQGFDDGNSLEATDYTGRLFRVNASAGSGSQATSLTHCPGATAACNNAVSTTSNSAPHADSRSIAFDANGNLMETDDGGIYRRTNPTGTGDWFSVNGTLQITEMHNVVYDRVSNMIMSGNQDNGTTEQTTVGGTVWEQPSGGDGGDVSVDDDTSFTQSTRYSSFQLLQGFVRRIVNDVGVTTSWWYPSKTLTGGGSNIDPQFTTPVELNRVDPRRILFAGYNDLYESLDRGDTVTALGLNRDVQAMAFGGRSGATDNVDVIYAISYQGPGGTLGPFVYLRSSGGGAPVQTATKPGTGFLRDIAVDATDWTKAYVVNDVGQVYSTANSGTTWTNITGNLGSGSTDLRTITFIPGSPNVIAVGGVNGVFRMATNSAGTWNQLGTGMSNAIVHDLDYDALDDTLVAGTLGRGAWKLSPVTVSGTLPSLSVADITVTEGNSGSVNATFTVSLSSAVAHTVGVKYATADGSATVKNTTFSNSSSISMSDGAATPYPSSISVSGVTGNILKVTATLNGFNHTWGNDVDVLLVGPSGQGVVLMSDVSDDTDLSGVNLTIDDAAPTLMPATVLSSGTYRPTNLTDLYGDDIYFSPAPFGSFETALSIFNGASPNGTWSLYVVDDYTGESGSFAGGWSITFSTAGGDYSLASGSLVFNPGTTSRTVSVTVHGDTTAEVSETFFLNLTNPSNATISDSQAQATITNDDALTAPANVVATATTTTNVNISWTAAPVASTYRVYRSTGGAYSQVGETSGTTLSNAVSPDTSYLYKVRSFAAIESPDSNIDLATSVIFTNPTITVGTTSIKLAHFTELRTAVNAVRALASLSAFSFTAPTPATNVTVRAVHVTDLRNALTPARSALSLPAQTFTDPTITAGTTGIKAVHINELRNGVQ